MLESKEDAQKIALQQQIAETVGIPPIVVAPRTCTDSRTSSPRTCSMASSTE
jgi:hypothetical protein